MGNIIKMLKEKKIHYNLLLELTQLLFLTVLFLSTKKERQGLMRTFLKYLKDK